MKIKLLVAFCIMYLPASWVQAEADADYFHPSYSYFEASYLGYDMDVGGVDTEPDGYKLKL